MRNTMLGITVFSFITLVPALVRGAEVGGIEGQVSTAANGEESYVATWRIAGRKRDAAGVLQPVPWTTQTTKILKDDPMPTLVYNCAMLPHICKNVEDHPTYGGNSDKTFIYDPHDERKELRGNIACPAAWAQGEQILKDANGQPIQRILPDKNQPNLYKTNKVPNCPDAAAAQLNLGLPSGTWWSCDEFPFRSSVQGGDDAQSRCAPQNKNVLGPIKNLAVGNAAKGEQDFQAKLHDKLARLPTATGQPKNYKNDGFLHYWSLSLTTDNANPTWGKLIYPSFGVTTSAPPVPGNPSVVIVTTTETKTTTIVRRDMPSITTTRAITSSPTSKLGRLLWIRDGITGVATFSSNSTAGNSTAITSVSNSTQVIATSDLGSNSGSFNVTSTMNSTSTVAGGSSQIGSDGSSLPSSTTQESSSVPETTGPVTSSDSSSQQSSSVSSTSGGSSQSTAESPSPSSSGGQSGSTSSQNEPTTASSAGSTSEQGSSTITSESSTSSQNGITSSDVNGSTSGSSDFPSTTQSGDVFTTHVPTTLSDGQTTETDMSITAFYSTSTITLDSSTIGAYTTNLPDDDDDDPIIVPIWPIEGSDSNGCPLGIICGLFKIPTPPYPVGGPPPIISPPLPGLPEITVGTDGKPTEKSSTTDSPSSTTSESSSTSSDSTTSESSSSSSESKTTSTYTITALSAMVTDSIDSSDSDATDGDIADEAQDLVDPHLGGEEPSTLNLDAGATATANNTSTSTSSTEGSSISTATSTEPSASISSSTSTNRTEISPTPSPSATSTEPTATSSSPSSLPTVANGEWSFQLYKSDVCDGDISDEKGTGDKDCTEVNGQSFEKSGINNCAVYFFDSNNCADGNSEKAIDIYNIQSVAGCEVPTVGTGNISSYMVRCD